MENQEIKAWDGSQSKIYITFNSLEEYFQYLIENKKSFVFSLKKGFSSKNKPSNMIEAFYADRNQSIIYTDHDHPITLQKLDNKAYIDRSFFDAHKKECVDFFKKYLNTLDRKNTYIICIHDYAITEEELLDLINNPDLGDAMFIYYLIDGKELSSEHIKLIKERHLDFVIEENDNINRISNNKAIKYYTYSKLQKMNSLNLSIPDDINLEEVDNYIYIGGVENSAEITFNYAGNRDKDLSNLFTLSNMESISEEDYYQKLIQIFQMLAMHNKKYTIIINVINREKLRQSGLLENLPQNVNIKIKNDNYQYTLEEFMTEEKKLQELLEPIKKANLSPFEKYLAAYNLAKQFKEYKENDENRNEARYLRYILDEKNKFIVCVGFAKLLEEFLDYLEIPNIGQDVSVDISYDGGFTMEEKEIDNAGHARCIVKIDDDKYNIHGIYVADPTWDNNLVNDDYLNALMTFDRKKEARRLEMLSTADLFLDFHSREEFSQKTTFYLERYIKDNCKNKKANHNKAVCLAYEEYYFKILNILFFLDYQKYIYFQKKYSVIGKIGTMNPLEEKEFYKKSNQKILDETFNNMLDEYFEYIISLTNKQVRMETILEAAAVVKSQVNGYSREEIEKWLRQTTARQQEREMKAFPYEYNPQNRTEAYLEERKNVESKVK